MVHCMEEVYPVEVRCLAWEPPIPAHAADEDEHDKIELKQPAYGKLVLAPFAAQWSWLGGRGKYYAFPADANTELEGQYYQRQLDESLEGTPVEIASSDHVYRIDFEDLMQENIATGWKRPISREIVTAQWYWSGRGGENWYPFAENDNQSLEAGFQKLSFCAGTALFDLPTTKATYHIDLEQMTQRNSSTGRVRNIKRMLGGSEDLAKKTASSGSSRTLNLTLKVTPQSSDCRRFSCSIPPYSTGAWALPIVRNTVENGFQDLLEEGRPYKLCYEDEDGDKCELVEDTWEDCMRHVSDAGVLKLSIAISGDITGAGAGREEEGEEDDEEDDWAIVDDVA